MKLLNLPKADEEQKKASMDMIEEFRKAAIEQGFSGVMMIGMGPDGRPGLFYAGVSYMERVYLNKCLDSLLTNELYEDETSGG